MINTVEGKKKSTFSPSLFSFKKKNLGKKWIEFQGRKKTEKGGNFLHVEWSVEYSKNEKKNDGKKSGGLGVEMGHTHMHTHTHTYTKADDPFNGA